MSFNNFPARDQHRLLRVFSQSVYYAHRGFEDAARVYAPSLTPSDRRRLSDAVAGFIQAYITAELGLIINNQDVQPETPAAIIIG